IDRGEYLEGTSDAKVIALAKKLAVKANKMKIPEFLALKILVNNIKAGKNQKVFNVYMPNQLISNIATIKT
ncbi:MAG TPA: hypothetical protein VLG67_00310, partial [Candidatus Saccharimonadales bacterium]|nr:hypothetical protein [Candidatus Saccharimonadales bacterium]